MNIFSFMMYFVTNTLVYNSIEQSVPVSLGGPVILIPGLGGSQIEARLNRTTTLHYICSKKSDWYTAWVSIYEFTWPVIECFSDNLRLLYDTDQKITKDNEGVDIRVPGFGSTYTVDYLDSIRSPLSSYFAPISNKLVASGAYIRGVNLHGAPYDFRKGPSELHVFFENLTTLVESTYTNNKNKKVTLVAHSMGCPLTLLWLNNRSTQWKHKYIKWFVPIAGVWAGSLKSIRLLLSGDNINLYVVNALYLRPLQRSSPSSLFLLPSLREWSEEEVLVQTNLYNYTVKDYDILFKDIEYDAAKEIWERDMKLYDAYKAPKVPVYAIYGNNVETPTKFIYTSSDTNWMNKQPIVIYESAGDGTVNERSLRLIEKWKQNENLTIVSLDRVEHLAILSNRNVIDAIMTLVSD